jgi:hypothetical protein
MIHFMQCIEYTNIKDALTLKYGEPKIEHKKEIKEYVNGFGNTIEKLDQSFDFRWDTGSPDITCYYRDKVKHNSSGEPNRYTVFGIENKRVFNEVKKLVQNKKEIERKENIKKLDNL